MMDCCWCTTSAVLAAVAVVGFLVYKRLFAFKKFKADDTVAKGNPADKVVLYGFKNVLPIASNPSVFVGKVQTFCKFANIPYDYKLAMPMKAPKGKLPFIKHGSNVVCDSHFIIKYLMSTYEGNLGDLKTNLTDDERAKSIAIQRLVEDNLYWHMMYNRWVDGWSYFRNIFFGHLAAPMKLFVPALVRKNVYSDLVAQGIARHSDKDRISFGQANLFALSTLLGQNKFFLGDQPAVIDSIVFPCLEGFLDGMPPNDPMTAEVKKYANLVQYVRRIQSHYFGLKKE